MLVYGELSKSFDKVIVLDYYDGLTKGIAKSILDEQSYLFEMLDWDNDQDIRLFKLSEITNQSFADIASAYAIYDEPRWPIWTPKMDNVVDVNLQRLYTLVQATLDIAKSLCVVFGWRKSDETIFLIKSDFSTDECSLVDWSSWNEASGKFNWFEFLKVSI